MFASLHIPKKLVLIFGRPDASRGMNAVGVSTGTSVPSDGERNTLQMLQPGFKVALPDVEPAESVGKREGGGLARGQARDHTEDDIFDATQHVCSGCDKRKDDKMFLNNNTTTLLNTINRLF